MKILYVTTIGSTMRFFTEHIKMLKQEGHDVELVCNCDAREIPESYSTMGLKVYNLPFSRSPISKDNIIAYKNFKKVVEKGNYDIVHTHTPNASVVVRLACRKLRKNKGLLVYYTAHGFHFYKMAPLKNWLLYYPAEWLCSWWTDTLITINQEDYNWAKKKMHAKRTEIIPGVGIDLERFNVDVDRNAVREELGISHDAKVLIYIAELNKNKNQMSLLDMMFELMKVRQDVILLLVGSGGMKEALEEKANKLGIRDKVVFAGYRRDIPQILKAADVCVPSSIREGLGLNIIEAMACGIPVVAYENRGHKTIINDGENGLIVAQGDYRQMAKKVDSLLRDDVFGLRLIKQAQKDIYQYSAKHVVEMLRRIYFSELSSE